MLNKLNTNKPAGIDGIHSIIIKNCANCFSVILAQIFQSSYSHGIVLLSWKSANITAVFKKGSKSDSPNYRLISLTSIPCKVMERIIRDVMIRHLVDQGLFATE